MRKSFLRAEVVVQESAGNVCVTGNVAERRTLHSAARHTAPHRLDDSRPLVATEVGIRCRHRQNGIRAATTSSVEVLLADELGLGLTPAYCTRATRPPRKGSLWLRKPFSSSSVAATFSGVTWLIQLGSCM